MAADIELASKSLDELPPLPTPDYATRQTEARRGVVTVVSTIGWCIAATHGLGLSVGRIDGAMHWVCMGLVYGLSTVALLCLAGLLLGDPGVVRRSEEACFPIPAEVQSRLLAGVNTHEGLANINDGESRSYCVRCLVWRQYPDGKTAARLLAPFSGRCERAKPHHCRICNRCVLHFDHHCGVFGRCIAGQGLRGNMKYFVTIIVCGYAGAFLSLITCVAGIAGRLTREGGWDGSGDG